MDCPTCGSSNPDGKRFCGDCGAALALVCAGCGSSNPPGKKFCGDCGANLTVGPGIAPDPPSRTTRSGDPATLLPEVRAFEGERRQLTVMFCDLVGSTQLAARLDPEDLREVIRSYQDCCAGVIDRFEGHVAKFMGDGVLAYFGYPHAHEDEAERAVRAGLDIIAAIRNLKPRTSGPLAVRVGIATGLVVVGDLIGQGASQERVVVGETPNLAARLQGLAEPDSLVISRRTRRLIGGLFEVVDLGVQQVKGLAEPVRAWRVVAESRAESRFEALRGTGLMQLIGRDHEIALLLDRFERARDGEGQVVLLAGEAGIGKSRIVRALRERLDDESYTSISHYCSAYHQSSALYPVIGLLERAARFQPGDSAAERIEKLESLLALSTDDVSDVLPLIAALLSVPVDDRYPPLNLTPQRQKQKTLEILGDQLAGLAVAQPVLAVYEDVHWIDPSSLDLLDLVIDQVQSLPILVIITYRPEFNPPWTGYPHVTSLSLSRLTRRYGRAMVERVTGGKALPAEVMQQIVDKTDGVPLFVEELTKAVLESDLLREAEGRYELTGLLPPLAIPTTLQDSLIARLGRLAPVKEVAQIGAAIGREFSYELLAAVAPLREAELQDALLQLTRSELIFRRGVPPKATYTFKHALVQDAAYATLLRSRRQQLHMRIATVLENEFPATAEMEPDRLAQHYTEAGLLTQAVDCWRRAGQRSMARSATAEAIVQLSKGLELARELEEGAVRQRQELALQVALGSAFVAAKGFAAPETGAAYREAQALSHKLDDVMQLFAVIYGQCLFHLYRAEVAEAGASAAYLLSEAEKRSDLDLIFFAHRAMGVASLPRGRLADARRHLEQALELYDPVRHRTPAFVYAFDPRVVCLDYLARALLPLGFPDQALQRNQEALAVARDISHHNSMALPLFFGATLHQLLDDRPAVRAHAEELIQLATAEGFRFWLAGGLILQGWIMATGGEAEAGVRQMRQGIADWRGTGAEYLVPYFFSLLADAAARVGECEQALELLKDALTQVDRTEERWLEAELRRRQGELLLRTGGPDRQTAESCFRRAMEVAQSQSARLWEMRATLALCRLLAGEGRREEASTLLGPLYASCAEGFTMPDLISAEAMLRELDQPDSAVAR